MRNSAITGLFFAFLLGACSGGAPSANQAAGNASAPAVAPEPSPTTEPATSPNALAAKAVVERYFALIADRNYADAYRLWGNRGGDTRGTLKDFTDGITAYSVYQAKVGDPTMIKSQGGKQYILVETSLDVKARKTGRTAQRSGTMMLSRSADPAETDADKKEWRIWGMDVRTRH